MIYLSASASTLWVLSISRQELTHFFALFIAKYAYEATFYPRAHSCL